MFGRSVVFPGRQLHMSWVRARRHIGYDIVSLNEFSFVVDGVCIGLADCPVRVVISPYLLRSDCKPPAALTVLIADSQYAATASGTKLYSIQVSWSYTGNQALRLCLAKVILFCTPKSFSSKPRTSSRPRPMVSG